MIKINLLPKTINQKRVIRNTAILLGFVLALVVAAGIAYAFKLKGEVAKMEELATVTEQWKARVEGIEKQAQQVRADSKLVQEKLDFINKVLDYNLKYPKLYEEIAKWTYEKVSLSSLQCDGQQVVMQARVKTLDDLGRYLLNMYRATDLFTEVTISGIPGYGGQGGGQSPGMPGMPYVPGMPMPGGGQISGSMAPLAGIGAIESGVQRAVAGAYAAGGISFTVTCKLKTPVVAPQYAAGGQAGQQGQPGMPGPMPGPMGPGPIPAGPMAPPGTGSNSAEPMPGGSASM